MIRACLGFARVSRKSVVPGAPAHSDQWCSWVPIALGLSLSAAMLGACEQQVANAEQPQSNSESLEVKGRGVQLDSKERVVFDKPACELPNHGAEVTGSCSVLARANSGRKGHLTYGPYLSLAPGDYRFEVEYRSSGAPSKPAGKWDVAARIGPNEESVAKGDIAGTGDASGVVVGRFTMPRKEPPPVVEIRMAPDVATEAEIKRLTIYQTAAQ